MIEKTLKLITKELEKLMAQGIQFTRALDLLEATTQSIEEIVALNALRESFLESMPATVKRQGKLLSIYNKTTGVSQLPAMA